MKDKLENIESKIVPSPKKKKNRNGNVGINKNNNYTPDKHPPRKVCSKCGSSNHLSMKCKNVVPTIFSQSMSANVDQNFSGFRQMPFLPNPYYLYGNVSMNSIPWGTPTVNNPFEYSYPENVSKSYSQPKASVKTKGQIPAPKVKVDLTSSDLRWENRSPSTRHQLKNMDPKQFGYQFKIDFVFNCVQGKRRNMWYLDSGCSRHMTGDSTLLTKFVERVAQI